MWQPHHRIAVCCSPPPPAHQVSPWEIEVDPETEKKIKEEKRRAEEAAARAQRAAAKERKQRVALGLDDGGSSDSGEGGPGHLCLAVLAMCWGFMSRLRAWKEGALLSHARLS